MKRTWREYRECSDDADIYRSNIDDLDAILSTKAFGQYAEELGVSPNASGEKKVKQHVQHLLKENLTKLNACEKRMEHLNKKMMKAGYDATIYDKRKIAEQIEENEETHWKINTDIYLDRLKSSKSNTSEANDFESDDSENEIDVLDDTDFDSTGIDCKVNFFSEKDDIQGKDTPYAILESKVIKVSQYKINQRLTAQLKPHQRDACQCIMQQIGLHSKGYLVAHAMGLGKSLTTIAAIDGMFSINSNLKIALLSPKSTLSSWDQELGKWDHLISFYYYPPIDDDNKQVLNRWTNKGGVMIMSHDRFRKYQLDGLDLQPDVLVIDEAHRLKNPENQFYKAVVMVKTQRRLLLTGSPLQNNLKEYFAMIQLIHPNLFKADSFKNEYSKIIDTGSLADASEQQILEAKQKIHIFTRLTESCVHRRSSAILKKSLPSYTDYKLSYYVDLSSLPAISSPIEATHAIANLAKSTKVELVKSLLRQIEKTGDSTLVFSKRRDVLELISENVEAYLMDGTTSSSLREQYITDFQKKEKRVFCMTTKVGGVGLNLQVANRIIILDPSWNPVDDKQACFRAWRLGQTKEVTIYRFVVDNSIEERIYKLAVHKSLAACRIIEDMDVERKFTSAQLESLDSFAEEVLDYNDIKDSCLRKEHAKYVKVSRHDVLFTEANSEKLSDEELADADNSYNQIIADNRVRHLVHPITNDMIAISKHDLYYPDCVAASIVTPSIPVWKKDDSGMQYWYIIPMSEEITAYIINVRNESNGEITERTVKPALMQKMFHSGNKRICLRCKLIVNDLQSEWSGWSAPVYTLS